MEKTIYAAEYSTFIKVLKAVREEAGISQSQLAEKLESKQTFVSRCERGERRLDIIELNTWCEALGLSLSAFAKKFESALEQD